MKQEGQLEKEIRAFDWKEWTPFLGLYFAPRNLGKGENSQSIKGSMSFVNGSYHATIIFAAYELLNRYI